jgi:hypothetical protein
MFFRRGIQKKGEAKKSCKGRNAEEGISPSGLQGRKISLPPWNEEESKSIKHADFRAALK